MALETCVSFVLTDLLPHYFPFNFSPDIYRVITRQTSIESLIYVSVEQRR